jgi:hypothetical protein
MRAASRPSTHRAAGNEEKEKHFFFRRMMQQKNVSLLLDERRRANNTERRPGDRDNGPENGPRGVGLPHSAKREREWRDIFLMKAFFWG